VLLGCLAANDGVKRMFLHTVFKLGKLSIRILLFRKGLPVLPTMLTYDLYVLFSNKLLLIQIEWWSVLVLY
jgi:hypothetical protein